ncbi:MAG: cupredoxin domain-containing protein [Pseudonocardiaceae bacterium]
MRATVVGALRRSRLDGRQLMVGAAVAGMTFAMVACSGGGTGSAPSSGGASTTTGGLPSGQPAGHQVSVQMTDFHLALSQQSLPPGTYTFVAVNAGQAPHAIEIDGPGVSDQRTPGDVQSGQSASMTVTLQPGSYEMYCPVDGHKAKGMDMHFTVGGGTSSNPPEPGGSTGGY